ncbi:MAG: M16 family metallopeptidase, partial [Thermoanaerobaculia bacterium]
MSGVKRLALLLGLLAAPAAAFDLARTVAETLPNGLRVLVLEDHTFPVVSVQMLYAVGARNEENGKTGLAHFLEHMAFRASANFPETDVVSRIYAVGGEWHGYTWIDQTTYFATVPREHWELLLAIEADRMSRLAIAAEEVEPERGAVLTELRSYENDPASVLYDAVVAASFVEHPYRNNTIGWVSDVERIGHADLVDFYRRHYRPANAVLAVVGDVAAAEVLSRARELFAALPAGDPTPLPRTRESAQRGVRRVELTGAGRHAHFAIAYRAPATSDSDWPAFLLLREVLAGGAGANFNQEDFGVGVRSGTRLADLSAEMTSWLPPTAQPYVLILAGSIAADGDPAATEAAIEERVAALRERPVGAEELATARE